MSVQLKPWLSISVWKGFVANPKVLKACGKKKKTGQRDSINLSQIYSWNIVRALVAAQVLHSQNWSQLLYQTVFISKRVNKWLMQRAGLLKIHSVHRSLWPGDWLWVQRVEIIETLQNLLWSKYHLRFIDIYMQRGPKCFGKWLWKKWRTQSNFSTFN